MENRVMYLTFGISITVALLLIIGFTNFYDSRVLSQEQAHVDSVKEMQAEIDEQFEQLQKTKKDYLQSLNDSILNADEDGDGLTFAEEIELKTSDYNPDSDLDGVPDAIDPNPAGGGETHTQTVEWFHNGNKITTQFGIPNDRYLSYKNAERLPVTDPSYVTYEDLTVRIIAEDIADVAEIIGEDCTHCLIIDFVQSMLYQFDIDYINFDEYPKFPIETIVDQRGDCEDTSYLLAALYKSLGVDAVLVLLPGHMATAVTCDNCTGAYYEVDGKKYYYVETTASGWSIGEIPDRFKNEKAKLIEI